MLLCSTLVVFLVLHSNKSTEIKNVLLFTKLLDFSPQYLSQCDIVLYMKNGKIAERGTYEELVRNNGVTNYNKITDSS